MQHSHTELQVTLILEGLHHCSTPHASTALLMATELLQGRSHQVWSDQVGSARARTLYRRGVCMLPQENLKFRSYEIASETTFGQYDASRRPNDRVLHEYHSAHCVVHRWCRLSNPVCLSAESHTLCRKLARLIVRTESC